jgi:hypothetical protein
MRFVGLACEKEERATPKVRRNATGFKIECTGTLRSKFGLHHGYKTAQRRRQQCEWQVIQKWIPILR